MTTKLVTEIGNFTRKLDDKTKQKKDNEIENWAKIHNENDMNTVRRKLSIKKGSNVHHIHGFLKATTKIFI